MLAGFTIWVYLTEAYCVLTTYLKACLMDSNWLLPLFASFSGLTLVIAGLCFLKNVNQAMKDGSIYTDELPVFLFI